jgi:membrane associated rhomboid family serine protease
MSDENKLPDGIKTLLIIWCAVFIFEVIFSGSFTPSVKKLAILGGSSSVLAQAEPVYWLRIFTALFLHGNIMHLGSNAIAALIGGPILERFIGKHWLWVIFLYGGMFGSIFSLLFGNPNAISVGASGGIMAIFSAALVVINTKILPEYRKNLNIVFLQSIVPSLIPFSAQVDYAAHFGGAISGVALGGLTLAFWPNHLPSPQGKIIASLLLALFVFCTIAAVLMTVLSNVY